MFFLFLAFILQTTAHLHWSEIIHLLEDSEESEDAVGDFFHEPLDSFWLGEDELKLVVGDFIRSQLQDLYHKPFDSFDESSDSSDSSDDFEEVAVGDSSDQMGATQRLINERLKGAGIGDLYADDDSEDDDYDSDDENVSSESELGYSSLSDEDYDRSEAYDDSESGESSRYDSFDESEAGNSSHSGGRSEEEIGEAEDAYLASSIESGSSSSSSEEDEVGDDDYDTDEGSDEEYESAEGSDGGSEQGVGFDDNESGALQNEAGTDSADIGNGTPKADHTFISAAAVEANLDPGFEQFASRFKKSPGNFPKSESPVKEANPDDTASTPAKKTVKKNQKKSPKSSSTSSASKEAGTHEASPMGESQEMLSEAGVPDKPKNEAENGLGKVESEGSVPKSAIEDSSSFGMSEQVKGMQSMPDVESVTADGRPLPEQQTSPNGRPVGGSYVPQRQLTPDGRPPPIQANEGVVVGDSNANWGSSNQIQQNSPPQPQLYSNPASNQIQPQQIPSFRNPMQAPPPQPFAPPQQPLNSPESQMSQQAPPPQPFAPPQQPLNSPESQLSQQAPPPQPFAPPQQPLNSPESQMSQQFPTGSYQWPVPSQYQQAVGMSMSPVSPVAEPPSSYQQYPSQLVSEQNVLQNTRPDVITVSSSTLLFHASSRPPGNLLWEEERVGGTNGPFEVSESPQNTYDELKRKSPATIMSFLPAKNLVLLKFTPKNLQILWPQIKRGRDARFHLWWHDFTMLGKKKNSEVTCTMQNIFRIVFGIKGGLSKVMEANPSGGCHLNPLDNEGSFAIQRLPRKDFDEHAVKFLCNTQPSDGYYADPLPNFPYVKGSTRIPYAWKDHEVKLGSNFTPSQQSPSTMYICDTNNLRNHQMFAMTLQQPYNMRSPYFSHKCADSFARQNVKVTASGGVSPRNVLHIDNTQWVSRQIANPWIQLDYGPKMAYADEVVLELSGDYGGILQGSLDGTSFSQPLAIVQDMRTSGNVKRTFRAPLTDKIFQYFRFRGSGPLKVSRIKFICNSYQLGGKIEGQSDKVVVEVYWAGKSSEHVIQTTVEPWQKEWTFDRSFDYLTKYRVRIASHPEGQTCVVNNPTGKITTEVDDIYIVCTECVCSGKEFKNSGGPSCDSVYQDRPWCYVEKGACSDEEPSKALKGYSWSFNACADKMLNSQEMQTPVGNAQLQPGFAANNGFT